MLFAVFIVVPAFKHNIHYYSMYMNTSIHFLFHHFCLYYFPVSISCPFFFIILLRVCCTLIIPVSIHYPPKTRRSCGVFLQMFFCVPLVSFSSVPVGMSLCYHYFPPLSYGAVILPAPHFDTTSNYISF